MAAKHKKPPKPAPAPEPPRLAEPFAALAELKNKLAVKTPEKKASGPAPKSSKPEPASAPPPVDEAALFMREMEGVAPIARGKKRVDKTPPPPEAWSPPELPNEDLEALRALSDLVDGRGEFDLSYTDEYVEGKVKGLPPGIMEELRAGRIPFQDHLDLHGLTLIQAEAAVIRFILDSVALGRGSVLLIHGRGQGSKDGVPVLKRSLEHFLLKTPLRKYILAFTSARPIDGGLGASYILLKR